MKNKFYTTSSVLDLEAAQHELVTAGNSADTFLAWVDACKLQFFDINDRSKQYPKNIDQVLAEYKNDLGHRLTAVETARLLQFYIDDKNDFKQTATAKKKLLVTAGPKYTKEWLADEHKPIQIRDELLHINSKDINLFHNFKLCGDQLVLIDGTDVELLNEDTLGRVYIDNRLYLKGNIADRVQFTFMNKISQYYKKLAEFLATLDPNEIVINSDDSVVETPIEDFIQTEMPTTFIKYYAIEAVYHNWVDKDKKSHKSLDHFELKRNRRIESFEDIFMYTLENWKSFKRCIQGQNDFLAWSNDSSKIAVSHWYPTEVKTMPAPWAAFLNEKMPKHLQMRLVAYLGMCMDERNTAQQYLIISDKGGTGKGVMLRALESVLPARSISSIDETALADTNEFGLAGIKIWNSHISVMEEYKSNSLQSNKAKKFIANNPMDLNVKGKNFIHWNPINHKMIVFSNAGAVIKDFANRRRAIPITFSNAYVWSKEKQEALNSTAKDFLNFCYTTYKQCPLIINGSYWVLAEEDEQKFLADSSALSNVDKDLLSKKAFSEECLKDYFQTDEYANTDDYIDFENYVNAVYEKDPNGSVLAKELVSDAEEYLADESNFNIYKDAFGAIKIHDCIEISTRSKQWWKFKEYLKSINCTDRVERKKDEGVHRVITGIKKKIGINLDDMIEVV